MCPYGKQLASYYISSTEPTVSYARFLLRSPSLSLWIKSLRWWIDWTRPWLERLFLASWLSLPWAVLLSEFFLVGRRWMHTIGLEFIFEPRRMFGLGESAGDTFFFLSSPEIRGYGKKIHQLFRQNNETSSPENTLFTWDVWRPKNGDAWMIEGRTVTALENGSHPWLNWLIEVWPWMHGCFYQPASHTCCPDDELQLLRVL